MADRSAVNLIVHDCPPEERVALVAAIADLVEEAPATADALDLGQPMYGGDGTIEDLEDIGDAIDEAAPGASYATWLDPKYEYPGYLITHAPGLGDFQSSCDADGNPTITASEVRSLLKVARESAADTDEEGDIIRAGLRRILGLDWEDRFAELRAAREEVAVGA